MTDIVMPRMTGLQLREKAAAAWPDINILLITGYAEDVVGNLSQISSEGNLLEKPFRPDDLVQEVRKLLCPMDQELDESRSDCHCALGA